MENQTTSPKQIILNYGLILAAISILLNIAVYAAGMIYEQDWKMSVLGLIIMGGVTFVGIKKYRELNGDTLTFGQGIKTGIGIALIAGLVGVVYQLIFSNFIEPDFMNNMMDIQKQAMIEGNPNLTDEQIDAAMEMSKKFSSPAITAAFQLIGSLFFGFVVSLVCSLILKKDPTN